jgi:hypothetical protein
MYTNVLRSLFPETRDLLKKQVGVLKQESGILNVRRAKVAEPWMVKKAVEPRDGVSATIFLMWVSVSRHKDLLNVREKEWITPNLLRMRWGVMKSDRFGQRAPVKYLYIPEVWTEILQKQKISDYLSVARRLKGVEDLLTVHSIRRGASTALANLGYAMEQLPLLTAHSMGEKNGVGVRRYVDPSPQQPEGRLQQEMSMALYQIIQ